MAHLAGIDKGTVLDWTDDNGLMECYCRWRKKVEVLFKGLLNNANDPVKCNYTIYWPGDTGMELVEKKEIEGKITDANRNNLNRYFELFEEHIAPKSNALIVVVELKEIFQGSMSLKTSTQKLLDL